jgi:hypothetical protein
MYVSKDPNRFSTLRLLYRVVCAVLCSAIPNSVKYRISKAWNRQLVTDKGIGISASGKNPRADLPITELILCFRLMTPGARPTRLAATLVRHNVAHTCGAGELCDPACNGEKLVGVPGRR